MMFTGIGRCTMAKTPDRRPNFCFKRTAVWSTIRLGRARVSFDLMNKKKVVRAWMRRNGEIVRANPRASATPPERARKSVIVQDITEHKRIEEVVRGSEERLRTIIDQANAGIARYDRRGRIRFANPRLCKMLGYLKSELEGKTVLRSHMPGISKGQRTHWSGHGARAHQLRSTNAIFAGIDQLFG